MRPVGPPRATSRFDTKPSMRRARRAWSLKAWTEASARACIVHSMTGRTPPHRRRVSTLDSYGPRFHSTLPTNFLPKNCLMERRRARSGLMRQQAVAVFDFALKRGIAATTRRPKRQHVSYFSATSRCPLSLWSAKAMGPPLRARALNAASRTATGNDDGSLSWR